MTNGLTKPSERFRQEVEPALAEYRLDPLSERLANNLARALDHHAEWTFAFYRDVDSSRLCGATNEKSFRRQLLSQCPELQMMNDLSDAAHHRFLTWPNDPPRVIDTSTAAYSIQAGELHVPNYHATFSSAATKAVDFWRKWKD
jgi:hypothetical protein